MTFKNGCFDHITVLYNEPVEIGNCIIVDNENLENFTIDNTDLFLFQLATIIPRYDVTCKFIREIMVDDEVKLEFKIMSKEDVTEKIYNQYQNGTEYLGQ